MRRRFPTIFVLFLSLWWLVPGPAAFADEVLSPGNPGPLVADEAFATYVDWAAADLKQSESLTLRLGRSRVPVGFRNLTPSTSSPNPGSIYGTGGFSALHSPAPEGVSGVGLTLRHPKGISYMLHYGSGSKADNLNLFESLERDLALDIDSTSFAQAYGGSFSWRTPVEGFTLKGAVSQMHLTGDALTRPTPQWLTAGIQSATRGRLFNTTRTWRAGAEQTIGDLKLSAEYTQSQMDTRFNDNVRVQQVGEGYTGKAAYRVNNWLQVGSSYSLYFADREDKSGEALAAIGKNPAGAWIQDIGVSARFDLNTRMALHLEGHLMNGLLGVVEGTEEDWRRFGARMTINW